MVDELDAELVRQIHLQADAAERTKPTNQDISAIAVALAEYFPHREEGTSKSKLNRYGDPESSSGTNNPTIAQKPWSYEMTNESITEEEQRRLEFFALQSMVKCCIYARGVQSGDPGKFARDLSVLYEKSIDNFNLRGAGSEQKIQEYKDLMQTFGAQWISEASQQKR